MQGWTLILWKRSGLDRSLHRGEEASTEIYEIDHGHRAEDSSLERKGFHGLPTVSTSRTYLGILYSTSRLFIFLNPFPILHEMAYAPPFLSFLANSLVLGNYLTNISPCSDIWWISLLCHTILENHVLRPMILDRNNLPTDHWLPFGCDWKS